MELTRPGDLKRLLEAHGLSLTKRFGQHFLVDRNHLNKVLDAAQVTEGDRILEIGPGVGTLTVELARHGAQVTAVEIDQSVLPALRESVAPFPAVQVVHADALSVDLPSLLEERWGVGETGKVVANIPYNITSPLLVHLLAAKERFSSLTLMVQKEVAQRLRAKSGTADYGALTVFAQFHATVEIASIVPRGAFFPPPKVDSAVIHLIPHRTVPVEIPSEEKFFLVSRAAFGQRRKTLLNALTNSPNLSFDREQVLTALVKAGIEEQRRGETLSLHELAAVSRALFGTSEGAAESPLPNKQVGEQPN
ncbi:MAG: 16S rRNA (adenine(1518)-N(6)/adenine(1519)-N(6)) -dimethyltransferase RsmA [Armatimonadaceae bacterium]